MFQYVSSFSLLAHKKKKQKERHPAVPFRFQRNPLCFSLLTGRWKLTAVGGSDIPASLFVNTCDAQQDRMGPQKQKNHLLKILVRLGIPTQQTFFLKINNWFTL